MVDGAEGHWGNGISRHICGSEPLFAGHCRRTMLDARGTAEPFRVTGYALQFWRAGFHIGNAPDAFVITMELPSAAHLDTQAAIQPFVDNAFSKAINVPKDYPFETFEQNYTLAYDKGLKGCTTVRPNAVTEAVLAVAGSPDGATSSCNLEQAIDLHWIHAEAP